MESYRKVMDDDWRHSKGQAPPPPNIVRSPNTRPSPASKPTTAPSPASKPTTGPSPAPASIARPISKQTDPHSDSDHEEDPMHLLHHHLHHKHHHHSHRHHHKHHINIQKQMKSALRSLKDFDDDEFADVGFGSPQNQHWKMDPNFVCHKGGCHCGAVRFEVFASSNPTVIECNCSICVKKQNHHFIVPQANFKLLKGHNALTTYSFNTHKAKHIFCSTCGVQSFYIPRSNSDGYGVVAHCLDEKTVKKVKIEKFDGKNWEAEIKKKIHIPKLSKAKI